MGRGVVERKYKNVNDFDARLVRAEQNTPEAARNRRIVDQALRVLRRQTPLAERRTVRKLNRFDFPLRFVVCWPQGTVTQWNFDSRSSSDSGRSGVG